MPSRIPAVRPMLAATPARWTALGPWRSSFADPGIEASAGGSTSAHG